MQKAEPVVRQATDDDLPKIVDDYRGNVSNPLNPFTSVDGLKRLPRRGLLVAEIDVAYAGFLYWFLAAEPQSDSNVDKYARVVEVKVKKEFRNEKVGLRLLSHALKDIDNQNVSAIYVDAPEMNMPLRSLYEKAGFTTFGRTVHMRHLYPPDRTRTKRPRKEARELAVFMVEAREQCRAFMTAYSELTEMLAKGPPSDAERLRVFSARVWSRIQAALASCAVVSKILWPQPLPRRDGSDKTAVHRGRELRQFLKLPNQSPFPLGVRNAFEHIDERIAAWLPEQKEEIPWGWSLSPFLGTEEPEDSSKALRYFNIVTMELRVADARCNLKEVMLQVRDIEERMPEDARVVFKSPKDLDSEKSEGKGNSIDSKG